MYQKSPLPYVFILLAIIALTGFTSFTIDKKIEQPIVHIIEVNKIQNNLTLQKEFNEIEESIIIAFNK